jgi:uncharacterized OsmC-like protein
MTDRVKSIAKQRQDPLRERYRTAPDEARIADSAKTVMNGSEGPFHATVVAGNEHGASWCVGIHRAVGGYHDRPNPGDILCAALASCFHSTLRLIADRLEIPVAALEVSAHADVDVRGTLLVDRNVPVGFQKIRCQVRVNPGANVPPEKVKILLAAAEHSCVVLQTLRNGVSVKTQFDQAPSMAVCAIRQQQPLGIHGEVQ